MRPTEKEETKMEQALRYQVWFSGGPGTSPERYLCSEWATLEAAQGYIDHYDHFGAGWEIVDTQTADR